MVFVSGSKDGTIHLVGVEAARLVRSAASTLGDPSSGRYAIIGGLAVLCRCETAKRVTSDIDTVTAGLERGALVAEKMMIVGAGAPDDMKFDWIVTDPLELADLEGLPEKQQLFLAAHRWALESAGLVNVDVDYRDNPNGSLRSVTESLAVARAPHLLP